VASNKGLFAFKDGKFRLRSRGSGDGQFPVGNGMISLRSGKFLVGSNNMLLEHRGDSFDSLLTVGDNPNQANLIRETFEDSRGALWISTESALYQYRDGTLRKLTARDGFPGGWVQSFYEDPAGTLWLGVSNVGLMRYRENTFTTISPEQGLFDYNVYTILEDDNGYLWMSSNKGAFRARKQQLNDVADGKAAAVSCDVYGVADGMGSRECNGGYSPSGFRLRDGRLAFSTTGGVTIVNPADIRINPIPPPVVIEKFVVEGVAQDTRSGIRIEPGKRRLEFHYAGISFIGAPQVRYRYQLVGLDKDWIDAGPRRDAYYTQLDPGTYTFRVIAANSDGVWNETGASLTFDMEPFFYQSSWFIGIVALFFLTSGPSFYLYRMRAMKKRRAELERQVQERTAELRKTLDNLKEAQNQLILSEKMASLGQLTAGIAHEIKNPLNFINNFAVLSHDLTADLRKELLAERDRVDRQRAIEIEEILRDLEQNVSKINEHGKRADSIVRGMLLHSRGKAGERQNTDLNALLAEYTNLAYHGMRAQDHSFNVKIETDLDPAVGAVSVVPQDLSRAFLNIINNACYAANEKRRTATNGFSPVVRVSARNLQDQVEIRIRDNGNGIPGPIREKIFNPFFTTKPAGVGTGLGLSLSYDIITQVHKGSIRVDTREGEFTEFVITIPRYPAEERGASS
jgi:signal transduction histidine kinase